MLNGAVIVPTLTTRQCHNQYVSRLPAPQPPRHWPPVLRPLRCKRPSLRPRVAGPAPVSASVFRSSVSASSFRRRRRFAHSVVRPKAMLYPVVFLRVSLPCRRDLVGSLISWPRHVRVPIPAACSALDGGELQKRGGHVTTRTRVWHWPPSWYRSI